MIEKGGESSFSLNEIMTYYGIVRIIWNMTNPFDFKLITGEIKSGNLNKLLLKPVNPVLYYVFQQLGETVIYWTINAMFVLLFLLLLGITPVLPSNLLIIPILFVLLIFAKVSVILFYATISTVGFWTTETKHLHHILINMVRLFGGSFLPLAILPSIIGKLADFLPFKYAISFPVNFYLGRFSFAESLYAVGILVVWIVGLSVLSNILWKKGLRNYEAIGG